MSSTSDVDMHQAQDTPRTTSAWRVFLASGVGTALEYYDFLVYGLAAALVFGPVFFPTADPLLGVLLGFATFGTGFLARPIGGIVLGHFGDKIGRRAMLILTLIVMGVSTFLIGCVPGYDTIGIAAPVLLVVLRLIQGFAAGGEWGGAALNGVESAPANRRGFWGSFTSMGVGMGGLLGAGVFGATSAAFGGDLVEFGWRIPFWVGGLVAIFGLVARLFVLDTTKHAAKSEVPKLPIGQVLRKYPRFLLFGIGVSYAYNSLAYLGGTFLLSYVKQIGYPDDQALAAQLVYSAVSLVAAPAAALLSDRIGRRRVVIGGAVLAIFMLFGFFALVSANQFGTILVAFGLVGIITCLMLGPLPTFLSEQFPREVRYSGVSASYQIGAAIGGGTAAVIATALLLAFGSPLAPAAYGAFVAIVLIVCTLGLREGRGKTLSDLGG
ncbi:MFS transporter [Herbiconiux sp. A18JL235]|uniref:MFS transporter n=1 Tax=Herbiconiux sp. A18JL235 TaxID=3152363 RepID=A0AB39BGM6_9MICO